MALRSSVGMVLSIRTMSNAMTETMKLAMVAATHVKVRLATTAPRGPKIKTIACISQNVIGAYRTAANVHLMRGSVHLVSKAATSMSLEQVPSMISTLAKAVVQMPLIDVLYILTLARTT